MLKKSARKAWGSFAGAGPAGAELWRVPARGGAKRPKAAPAPEPAFFGPRQQRSTRALVHKREAGRAASRATVGRGERSAERILMPSEQVRRTFLASR